MCAQGALMEKSGFVLSFLQHDLERHLSASTLKVYIATIMANHNTVGGRVFFGSTT